MSGQDELMDRLFESITAGDIDAVSALYADGVAVWNSPSRRTMDKEQSLALLRAFVGRTEEVSYGVLERRHWEGGAVQRHVLRCRIGGDYHDIDVCIVFAFADGRITRIFEYLDGRALAPLGW